MWPLGASVLSGVLFRSVSAGWADEAGLVGDDDELGAVAGVQFHHGPLDVGADGQRPEEELPGDLLVGVALGGQRHHLALTGGQAGEAVRAGRVAVGVGAGQEAGDQRPGGLRGEQGVSGGDGTDAGPEIAGADVLAEEAAGARTQRLGDVPVDLARGPDQGPGSGQVRVAADGTGGRPAVGAGPADVPATYVRPP